MAQLDRLGNAKATAQIGAAIGREFSHALLASVARESEAELTSSLDRLLGAGLLYRQGSPPHATYLFKHALIQDAAYGTLLREPRRALHAALSRARGTPGGRGAADKGARSNRVLRGAPILRREQIKLQIGLASALMQTKGYAASETKAALEQAQDGSTSIWRTRSITPGGPNWP